MQGPWVQSMLQKDFMCLRATKPYCHKYWAGALETELHKKRSQDNESLRAQLEDGPSSVQLEKAHTQWQRPKQPKIND